MNVNRKDILNDLLIFQLFAIFLQRSAINQNDVIIIGHCFYFIDKQCYCYVMSGRNLTDHTRCVTDLWHIVHSLALTLCPGCRFNQSINDSSASGLKPDKFRQTVDVFFINPRSQRYARQYTKLQTLIDNVDAVITL